MALNFRPKPGKPHIRLQYISPGYFIWLDDESDVEDTEITEQAKYYCCQVNPDPYYKTPGEAARALHYGSEKK